LKTSLLGHEISRPSYIPITAWLRHGPFATWLVKAARPRRLVELGSHYGYSYFAFCQAVAEAGLATECVAIDTWQGDEHAGFYDDDEVFRAVEKENRQYVSFSTLLRKTFAEALDDVEDASVELLHVDGRHFYEDVKEDFESWIPKLAERSVILFHDTEVRRNGFGVWRYWRELVREHETFNFTYQHGLGVLFRGDDLTPEMEAFRRMSRDEAGRDAIHAVFASQGERVAADHTQMVLADRAEEGHAALSALMMSLENVDLDPEGQVQRLDRGGRLLTRSLLTAKEQIVVAGNDAKVAAAENEAQLAAAENEAQLAAAESEAKLATVENEAQLAAAESEAGQVELARLQAERDEGRRKLERITTARNDAEVLLAQALAERDQSHAQLDQTRAERDQSNAQLEQTRAERDVFSTQASHLAGAVSEQEREAARAREEGHVLRRELARTRSKILRVVSDRVNHRFLRWLSSSRSPLGTKAKERFRRSALKRDPKRSLARSAVPALPGMVPVPSLPAPSAPSASGGSEVIPGRRAPDPERGNVLVVSHEATLTGAPILAHNVARVLGERYNVSVLCIKPGNLMEAFLDIATEVIVAGRAPLPGDATWRLLASTLADRDIEFAVTNSIESASILPLLHDMDITNVALFHEFASFYERAQEIFIQAVHHADNVVFSTSLTADDAGVMASIERTSKVHVLPQGKCVVPVARKDDGERERLKAQLRPRVDEDAFLVIGAGFVQPRKGVDLFIEVARQVRERAKGRKPKFVWIGNGFDDEFNPVHFLALKDQLRRSGLEDIVRFIPSTSEIEYAYELADMFLLPSRLDPLPNVAIDSLFAGLPVLCFDKATGIAPILRQSGLGETCIADYLNTADMADRILTLIESPELYADVSERGRECARRTFDMDTYVDRIEALAQNTNMRKGNRERDIGIMAAETRFDPGYVMPLGSGKTSKRDAAVNYIGEYSNAVFQRRPEPGFNPSVYVYHHRDRGDDIGGVNPYSDFLSKGRPEGPWSLPVIRNTSDAALTDAGRDLKCALHVHAYYVDVLGTLLGHIGANRARPSLYVSVSDEDAKTKALSILEGYEGGKVVSVMPNAGRDIGPFLTGFGADLVEAYDVVGHVHTKKSVALSNDSLVRIWTDFLFENVLGGDRGGPMLDRTLNAFAADERLGIVFPSDPNMVGWSRNRTHPGQIAERLGMEELPVAFDFPVGTMFWMRAEALRPFVDMGLKWSDYPPEPIGMDGTMLHALERFFGIHPVQNGWNAGVTHVTGLTR